MTRTPPSDIQWEEELARNAKTYPTVVALVDEALHALVDRGLPLPTVGTFSTAYDDGNVWGETCGSMNFHIECDFYESYHGKVQSSKDGAHVTYSLEILYRNQSLLWFDAHSLEEWLTEIAKHPAQTRMVSTRQPLPDPEWEEALQSESKEYPTIVALVDKALHALLDLGVSLPTVGIFSSYDQLPGESCKYMDFDSSMYENFSGSIHTSKDGSELRFNVFMRHGITKMTKYFMVKTLDEWLKIITDHFTSS
jgi:hypothetical protein